MSALASTALHDAGALTLQQVLAKHLLPFTMRPDQVETCNELADWPRAGLYCEVGTGKTVMSTVLALMWNADVNIVTMPPILLKQWKRWLESIGNIGDVVIYRGTPKERAAIGLVGPKWILMTIQILKQDFDRLKKELGPLSKTVTVDEATCVKNPTSQNHKAVAEFSAGHNLALLTGTPLSTPHDTYAYVKLISPGVYRSKTQFDNIHVAEKDFYENVVRWQNLDLMQTNLMMHSVRLLKENVLKGLKSPNYIPIEYELAKEHKALYDQIAEEQLLLLGDGKIDMTNASKLYNVLQQIIVNWDFFCGDENARSTAFDLVDYVMDEAQVMRQDKSKLIIFTYYKMTSRKLLTYLQEFGVVGAYSEISSRQQEINSERFKFDPACRILVAQPISGGFGSDYQHVCNEVLFLESPRMPIHFNQGVGRVYRDGQPFAPNIHIGIASGTIQRRLFDTMLKNDELLNQAQGSYIDLREAIYGK